MTGGEPEVQTTLVPSEVVIEAPLQAVDGPILDRLRCGYLPPCTDDGVRYGGGHLYSWKKVKHMAKKGTVDYVGSNSDE